MGDRGNIRFVYDFPHAAEKDEARRDIFFYSHWGGSDLPATLAGALERGTDRWDDEAYLARIIFSEMVQNEVLQNTGYGIAPYMPDNEHDILVVDARAKTVNGLPFQDFIEAVRNGTFEFDSD